MARFNILDLFGPSAQNLLTAPAANANGVQNMLMTRPNPKPAPLMPAVDPQTTAAVAGPAPAPIPAAAPQIAQAAPAASRKGLFSIDPDRKAVLNDFFLGLAAGQTPQQSLALGAAQAAKGKSERGNVNDTVDWLKGRGMDEASARQLASSPTALGQYIQQINQPQDPMKALNLEKAQLEIDNLRNPAAKLTDDQREYQAAKGEGFDGTFMDYLVKMKEAGRNQVNIDTGEKLPPGFRWKDPNNRDIGVEPIPGGPATQIPGELAARVGLTESFLGQAPDLRKQFSSGDMTGPIDSTMAQMGIGKRGEAYRQLQSGVDALTRLLTGAGMNQTEAENYTQRYLVTSRDTPESAAGKIDQLVRELDSAKGMAMRGRGGDAPDQTDPLGIR